MVLMMHMVSLPVRGLVGQFRLASSITSKQVKQVKQLQREIAKHQGAIKKLAHGPPRIEVTQAALANFRRLVKNDVARKWRALTNVKRSKLLNSARRSLVAEQTKKHRKQLSKLRKLLKRAKRTKHEASKRNAAKKAKAQKAKAQKAKKTAEKVIVRKVIRKTVKRRVAKKKRVVQK
eukprot:Sspe_Gene.69292::Locus_40842_Transcript_1_3_Confidence_0.500_Length_656::g.69292::m.69292